MTESQLYQSLLAAAIAVFVWFLTTRSNEYRAVIDLIGKMIELGIATPQFEDDEFCEWIMRKSVVWNDEARILRLKYDCYCCFVFNLLERLWKHCMRLPHLVEAELHIKEIVWKHRRWWQEDHENTAGYEREFQRYVNRLIDECERQHGCP